MCYNGLLSRATALLLARPLMPRRPAVLLTSPRCISTSPLFPALSREGRTFCTPLQKSKAHLLPFQSLPASLQKPRVCRHQRFSFVTRQPSLATSANSSLFFTLLHQTASHPLLFQSVAHSLCVYPGWHPEHFLNSSTLNSSCTLSCSFELRGRSTSHLFSIPSVNPEPRRALFRRSTGMPARPGRARKAFSAFPSTVNGQPSTSAQLAPRPTPLLPFPPLSPLPRFQRAIISAPRHPSSPVPLRRSK
jgi:hypothetical protein